MTAVVDLQQAVPVQGGLMRLVRDVRAAQEPPRRAPSDALASLFDAELRVGLEAGDAARAAEAALALWRRSGDLLRCYAAIGRVLAAVGDGCGQRTIPTARANQVVAAAARVVAALRDRTRPGTAGRVLLAAPEGDHHVLALECLAHLLEDAGFHADVCGPLAPHELADAARDAVGVVLSVHLPTSSLPALVAAARRAAPEAVIAVGGSAAVTVPDADLLRPELPLLVDALRRRRCPLSDREREVVRCVADGLTNAEAADVLGVAAATLKTHLDHVFVKTGTSGRAAAVAVALRNGWIR